MCSVVLATYARLQICYKIQRRKRESEKREKKSYNKFLWHTIMTSFTQLGGSQTTVGDYTMLIVSSFTYKCIYAREKIVKWRKSSKWTLRFHEKYRECERIAEAHRSIQLCTGNGNIQKICRPQYSGLDDCTMLKVPSFTYNIDTKA